MERIGIGVSLFALGLNAWLQYRVIRLSQFWDGLMKDRFLRIILRKPLMFFQQMSSGEILYRLLNDLGTLPAYMTQMRWGLIVNIVTAMAIVGLMFYFNVSLTLLILAAIPLQILALRYFGQRCRLLYEKLKYQDQQLLGSLNNIISHAESVKAFRLENCSRHDWFSNFRDRLLTERRLLIIQTIFVGAVFRVNGLISILIIGIGGYWTVTGTISIGSFMAFMLVSGRLNTPVQFFASYHLNLQDVIMCCRRVCTTWKSNELNIKPDARLLSKPSSIMYSDDIVTPKHLHISGVKFAYPGTTPVLRNIDWELAVGQLVRLDGGNGTGKSTLLKLMAGFFTPQVGQICLNNTPFAKISTNTIRRSIIYTSATNYWFAGSIHDNVCHGFNCSEKMTRSYLDQLLQIVGLDGFITQLPMGLETDIIDSGKNLSAGEQQRLALVRVLLARPAFVFLDEALTSISSDDASNILSRMVDYLGSATSVVYVHHGVDFHLPGQHTVRLKAGILS